MVGGASILANYRFREATTNIDAILVASSLMKDAINRVGYTLGLPNGWLNADSQMNFFARLVKEILPL
jgi:hypothetical protein